jgi:hypothetical protein
LTNPFRRIALAVFTPVDQAPIENPLIVTTGMPNRYLAYWLNCRCISVSSAAPRTQL